MATSWSKVEAAPTIETNGKVHDPKGDLHYAMERRDGRLFVKESRVDEHGNLFHELEVEAHYVIGSGLQGRSYATDSNGYLTMLPVGWYSETAAWGLSPGYEVMNSRFDRPVVPECVACHNSEPPFIQGSGFRYQTPLPEGIGCEQCHGPGAEHVAKQRRSLLTGESFDGPDTSIVNPARLPADLQQDVCLQCHLLGDVVVFQPGKGRFDFRPGKRLRDFRSDFFTSEQVGDRPGSVGHVSRSMNSKCFTASGGRMTCALCHLPHEPLKETPPGHYNMRCLECHNDLGCSRKLEVGQSAREGDCVACHMPRVASANIGHAVTTEHRIRRPNEPVAKPIATDTKAARPKLPVGFWGDEGGGQLGSALVLGADYRGDRAMLEEGTRLIRAHLEREKSTEMLYRLGLGYYHLRQWDRAVGTFGDVLRRDPNHAESRPLLGSSLARMGRLADAAVEYEEMLRRYPAYSGADSDLALLYFELGRPDQLVKIARDYLFEHRPNALVLSLVAKAQLALNDELDEALALLKRAQSVSPFIPAPFMIEAQIAGQTNDVERAERALQGAIRADRRFLPAHLALGELLARQGRQAEAIQCYENVIRLEPGNAVAQRALQQLRMERPEAR
jgi:Flp pilus assembly protein TadD